MLNNPNADFSASISNKNIAFIGAGNMGGALMGGLVKAGHPAKQICAAEPEWGKLRVLEQRFGIQGSLDNVAAVAQADIVVLAVKPQIITDVLLGLRSVIQRCRPLVISIVAGTSEAALQKHLGGEIAIVRTMPNTPAIMGYGATALYANAQVLPTQREMAQAIFAAVGQYYWLDKESDLEIIAALSGTGPAYFFMLMEALEAAAIEAGLSSELVRPLTAQTALGSAHMLMQSRQSPEQLRKQVTSPGGGTEQAMQVLEAENFKLLLKKAFNAAKKRYDEMVSSFSL